ncbi:hypothetical protein FQR65_LT13806 [Abscondita terminalis]|nr:hypothetical protein FQR65_LT13806 [Abscondita terminalis]
MKVFIALFLISGFQLILGNCPECDGLSSLYELIGCGVSCRRGKCPTAYNCDNLLIRNKNHQQCYFNGQFYDVGTTLPDKYPSSDGTQNCSYQCNNDDGGISYYFNPYDCVDNLEAPTEDQCNKMLQLITPTYIQLGVAVSYTPGVCNIQLVGTFTILFLTLLLTGSTLSIDTVG